MSKDWKISVLLDVYGKMFLTEKQYKVVDLYYNADLSLSEIAQQEAITRQGVRDSIKRGELTLLEAEDKLGFYKKQQETEKLLDTIRNSVNAVLEENRESIRSRTVEKQMQRILTCVDQMDSEE